MTNIKTPFHTGHTGSRANRSTELILLLLGVVDRSDCVDDSDDGDDVDSEIESGDPVSGLVPALSQYDRARLWSGRL